MKKGIVITAATLGLAGMLYAGNGMGPGNCDGQGKGHGMHRGMGQDAAGMQQAQGRKTMGMWGRHGKKGHRSVMMKRIFSQLDLSDEQKEKIRQILRQGRGQGKQGMKGHGKGVMKAQGMKGQRQGMGKGARAPMDLGLFLSKDRFDKEAFKKALAQKWEARDKMRQQRRAQRLERIAERMEKIFAVLTPEQRQKLIELSKKN